MLKTHIVCFSGGIGSFAESLQVVQDFGQEHTILLFADTKMEDPDLYRFIGDCVTVLGCRVETISDGRTPWQVFEDVKFMGNNRIDPCSRILKRELLNRWIQDRYTSEQCEIHVGIDYSECHRLPTIIERYKPYIYRSLLVEKGIILSSQQKKQLCKTYGIDVPLLYELGFPHNNCGGFCVKAGMGQFKLLFEKLPNRYKEHEEKQEEIMRRNPKLKPFIRKVTNKVPRYMSLKEYREEFLEPNLVNDDDASDFGGCGCALE